MKVSRFVYYVYNLEENNLYNGGRTKVIAHLIALTI